MNLEARLAAAGVLAAGGAALLTPVAIRTAARWGLVDRPRGYRGHEKATPYLGGAAVLGAFLVALLAFGGDLGLTLPLAGGVLVLCLLGTLDDRQEVSPGLRVVVEVLVAGFLWACGLGWDLGVGAGVDLALTCVWVVAVVNAINLFDNMDGASSAIALAVGTAVAALGVVESDTWLAVGGAALAGASMGFLPFNLAPAGARIFLGDGGSMPLGLAVATLVMCAAGVGARPSQALVLGALFVALPILDTTLVVISRRRKGISVLTGGRDHLTHRTRRRLSTARAVAFTLGAAQVTVATIALVAVNGDPAAIVVVAAFALALGGALIAVLEREEDRLRRDGAVVVPPDALEKAATSRVPAGLAGDVLVVLLAVAAAVTPLRSGLYDSSDWVVVGLLAVVLAAVAAIRRPPALGLPAVGVLLAVVGIGVLSLVSTDWAPSVDQAIVDGNRWLMLGAAAGLMLTLVRTARRAVLAVWGVAVGTVVVAAVVLGRMLGGAGSDVFLGGRLNEPLGYINGLATVFLMGVWACFSAVEHRRATVAGLGAAGATVCAGLTLMSQSRGAAIALVGSAVVVLAVLPGRRRRAFALLVVGGAVAACSGQLLAVYDASQAAGGLAPPDDAVRTAARALLVAAAACGLVWGAAVAGYSRLTDVRRPQAARAGRVVLVAGAVALAVVGVAEQGRVGDQVDRQWEVFTTIEVAAQAPTPTGSRLVSGSGNRYEYWRVAWDAFRDEPWRGIGAGNFDRSWFQDRRVSEDVRQPHSLELQVVSELGLGGAVLLLALLAGFAAAVVGAARRRAASPMERAAAAAAAGVLTAWLVHTSVDWQHLLPGVTMVALLGFTVLARLGPPPRPGRGARLAVPAAVVTAVLVATAAASLTRQGLADHYRDRAFDAVAVDPERALEEADRSLRLNAAAVRSYYAKAAALARLDRGPAAQETLLEAARREPFDPVTWALLGDLATRRGLTGDAARYYDRARALNPRDPGLPRSRPRRG